MNPTVELFVDGVDFAEGPRWHEGRLWYSDFHQRSVYAVAPGGERTAVLSGLDDMPSGLGWLPDGTLLVVAMTTQRVMRMEDDGEWVQHADLSDIATWHANDMVVDLTGNAYVGNFGFDLWGGAEYTPSDLALVRPDGTASVVAEAMAFPNGMVITPDGSTLVVGQSFGGDYVAFQINEDGSLSDRREWARVEGMAPDGCTLDVEGAIWFADAIGSQVVRVAPGGEITHEIPTPLPTFACALGGHEGTTLHICCAPDSHPDVVAGKGEGAIYTVEVEVPHAGLP